jgi:hypothetical protein
MERRSAAAPAAVLGGSIASVTPRLAVPERPGRKDGRPAAAQAAASDGGSVLGQKQAKDVGNGGSSGGLTGGSRGRGVAASAGDGSSDGGGSIFDAGPATRRKHLDGCHLENPGAVKIQCEWAALCADRSLPPPLGCESPFWELFVCCVSGMPPEVKATLLAGGESEFTWVCNGANCRSHFDSAGREVAAPTLTRAERGGRGRRATVRFSQ